MIDELGKAGADSRRAALRALQGDSAVELEDVKVPMRAAVLATFNAAADPQSIVPQAYLRRSIGLYTYGLARQRAASGYE